MKCTFYRPNEVNVKEFKNIVDKLSSDLHELERENCNETTVSKYVDTLCSLAKKTEHDPEMSFLGLWDPADMPHDARVDFFYKPTYLATAFIIKAALLYPSLLSDTVKETLSSLLLACTARRFESGGVLHLSDCLSIFENAGITEFIEKYPNVCCEFNHLYKHRKAFLEKGGVDSRELWYI